MFTALSLRLASLRARYAEPYRAYHTQAHIDVMLAGLGAALADPAAAELAVWYHDAIYDPARADAALPRRSRRPSARQHAPGLAAPRRGMTTPAPAEGAQAGAGRGDAARVTGPCPVVTGP